MGGFCALAPPLR
jgi:hypothetical protein